MSLSLVHNGKTYTLKKDGGIGKNPVFSLSAIIERAIEIWDLELLPEEKPVVALPDLKGEWPREYFYEFPILDGKINISIPKYSKNYYINWELYTCGEKPIVEKETEEAILPQGEDGISPSWTQETDKENKLPEVNPYLARPEVSPAYDLSEKQLEDVTNWIIALQKHPAFQSLISKK